MSGHQVRCSNTSSCLNHPNNVSFLDQTPGLSQCPVTGANSLKHPCTSSSSEFSSCRSPLEQSANLSSLKLPVRKICMGRPYNSTCVEMSHLAKCRKAAKNPACCGSPHCLLCTDHPSDPSSPTFLDQLIKGIEFLDRSTNAIYTNCPKSLSLPKLAASCLEQAANSIYLDDPDHCFPRSHSNPSTGIAASRNTSTCMVPSTRSVNALQRMDDYVNTNCTCRLHSQKFTPKQPQRPGIKLPEIPLFGSGIFSLGRLPKFWEAIHSGWSVPEPIFKPSNSWW